MQIALLIATTVVILIVVLGINTIINTYAQLDSQPLPPLLWISEIPKDVTKDQVSQQPNNHIENSGNTSKTCEEKEEEIKELQVCSIKGGNKTNSDPLGLFTDILNKTL